MNNKNLLNVANYSRQQLLEKSESISKSAKRDLLVFQEHGITAKYLKNLDAKRVEFEKTIQHSSVIGNHKQITNLRNLKFADLKDEVRMTRSLLSLYQASEGKAEYAVLNSKLSNLSVAGLLNLGEQTVQFLEQNKSELTIYGFSDEKIAAFNTLLEEFRAIHYEQSNEMTNVDNQTKDRSDLKSELYKMVYFISSVGKAHWLRKDKTRYGDYVLQKRKHSPPTSNETQDETATTTVNSF